MTVELRRARTRLELEDVFALRHRVFAIEEGRLSPRPDGRLYDRFDSFEETVSLIAYVDGAPAGSIRVSLDGPLGSPLDDHYDLSALRQRCAMDGRQGRTAVVTSLCVRRDMRRIPRVTGGLLEAAVDVMSGWEAEHVVAIINPLIGALMQRVGLAPIGEPRRCPRVGQSLVSMHAPMSAITVPRLTGASLQGAVRYLSAGEGLDVPWAVVLAGRLRVSGDRTAGPGAVIGGPGVVAVTPAAVRVISESAVARYAAEEPEVVLRSEAIQASSGDLFNDLLRARVLSALDALGVIPLLDGRQTDAIARAAGLDAGVLEGLLVYLADCGVLHRQDGWRLCEPERLAGELAFVRWLTGGYGPVLDAIEALTRGEARYGREVRRDDARMAAASAEIGRRFTDAHLTAALSLPGVHRIADVGCGSGARLIGLCQAMPGLTAIGVDLSEDCCRSAIENIAAAGLSDRISVVCARAEDGIGSESVDLVLCVGMFHDLLNDEGAAAAFLSGVRAGLSAGGFLLIQDQLAVTARGARAWGPGFSLIHHLMGQRLFSESDCTDVLSAEGFRMIRRIPTDIPDNWIFLLQAE